MSIGSALDKRRWSLAILLVPLATLLTFIVLVSLSARSLSPEFGLNGSIQLASFSLQRETSQWYLTGTVELNLPAPIKDGLDSGVPLDFLLTFRVDKNRRHWFDKTLGFFQHRFRVSYYELTRHYRVQAVEADISRNFRSLSAAVIGMGTFQQLPLALRESEQAQLALLQSMLEEGEPLLASLSFKLDSRSLPLPLQPLIPSSWQLGSQEAQWQIN